MALYDKTETGRIFSMSEGIKHTRAISPFMMESSGVRSGITLVFNIFVRRNVAQNLDLSGFSLNTHTHTHTHTHTL